MEMVIHGQKATACQSIANNFQRDENDSRFALKIKMMKKLSTLILGFAFTLSVSGQSYSFSIFSEPYEDLEGDSVLLNDTLESYALLVLPVTFRSFGYDFGDTLSVGSGGYLVSSNYRGIALDPLWSYYYFPDADSKVSYAVHGEDGKHVLKIQWKQLAHKTLPDSRVNFQLWVYEENQSIEFRYGPGIMETPVTSGIFLLDRNFNQVLEAKTVGGKPSSPVIKDFAGNPLEEFPENGTVYRFDYLRSGIKKKSDMELKLYPNPNSGYFKLSGIQGEIVCVSNALGQKQSFSQEGNAVEIIDGKPGVYFMTILTKEGINLTVKFQIQ